MCRLDLLTSGSVGFVIKCVSVSRDNSYRQRTIIHNFEWQLTFFYPSKYL